MDKPTQFLKPLLSQTRVLTIRQGSLLTLVAGVSGLLFACSYVPDLFVPAKQSAVVTAERVFPPAQREVVSQPMTLSSAMDRALKHHLAQRVALQERAVSKQQAMWYRFVLSPQVTTAPSDQDRAPMGNGPVVASSTQTLNKSTPSLVTVWEWLDFGVRLVQAHQETDRTFVDAENQRRAVYTLFRDVRSAFWRAAAAQNLAEAIGPVIQQAHTLLLDVRQVERRGLKAQLESVRFQKLLSKMIQQLQESQQQLRLAKMGLAALLGLTADAVFELSIPDAPDLIPVDMTIAELEQAAFANRSGDRGSLPALRLGSDSAHQVLLRLLPDLDFQPVDNPNQEALPSHLQWVEAGTRVVEQLLDVVSGLANANTSMAGDTVDGRQHLTSNMAILAQVHLVYRHYLIERHQLQAAAELDTADRRLLQKLSMVVHKDSQSRLEYISTAASAVASRLQLYQAYADVQNAVSRILVTLGMDQVPLATPADMELLPTYEALPITSEASPTIDQASAPASVASRSVVEQGGSILTDFFWELLDRLNPFSSKPASQAVIQPIRATSTAQQRHNEVSEAGIATQHRGDEAAAVVVGQQPTIVATKERGPENDIVPDYLFEPQFFVNGVEPEKKPYKPLGKQATRAGHFTGSERR